MQLLKSLFEMTGSTEYQVEENPYNVVGYKLAEIYDTVEEARAATTSLGVFSAAISNLEATFGKSPRKTIIDDEFVYALSLNVEYSYYEGEPEENEIDHKNADVIFVHTLKGRHQLEVYEDVHWHAYADARSPIDKDRLKFVLFHFIKHH